MHFGFVSEWVIESHLDVKEAIITRFYVLCQVRAVGQNLFSQFRLCSL
jgi:hypothetical protein